MNKQKEIVFLILHLILLDVHLMGLEDQLMICHGHGELYLGSANHNSMQEDIKLENKDG